MYIKVSDHGPISLNGLILALFPDFSILMADLQHPWVHGLIVWWAVLRTGLTVQAFMLSEGTTFYH